MGYLPYQLVQDFFQQYHHHPLKKILSMVEKIITQVQSNAKMHIGGAPCESQVASGWFLGMKKFGGFVDEPTWRPKDFKLKLPVCLLNLMMYVDVDVSYVCLFYFCLAGCGCGCCSNLTTQWSQSFGRWWMYGDCKIHFAKASFCIVANISGAVVEVGDSHTRCHWRWAYCI